MGESTDDVTAIWTQATEHAVRFRHDIDTGLQRPSQTYGEALATFDEPTPEIGCGGSDVVEGLVRLAEPGLHAMTGRRFFGWVIGSSHDVGVAADWLTSAWGQNAGNHSAAPAASAAEAVSARWLLDILRLPDDASIGLVTGCTMANFVCLAAARGEVLRRVGWDVERNGLFGAPPIRVILGEDAHSTVFSALQYLGLGQDRVTRVPTDSNGAILADAFAAAIADAQSDEVVIAIAQAGQINTGAFDPFPAIVASSRTHRNCWLHIDGAFGLWARACPDRSSLAEGLEGADSWATDGHKWLQTPYDCGYAIVRDPDAHRRAMTIAASYLPSVSDGERDPSHYVPELSRRARGFSTWAMLKHLGRTGIADMVERHCRLARTIAEAVAGEPGIAVMNDVVLNQVAVRFGVNETSERGDQLTLQTIAAVQDEGVLFAGGAKWKGVWVMRLSVIGFGTQEEDARLSAEAIIQAWRRVRHSTVTIA
ncbi:MAG: pyridoxal-dependent decarboxylase [Fimbriimonas sp.]|nr:pyridoxal-dependent decarboxylase [Fimbriimonas sp.]